MDGEEDEGANQSWMKDLEGVSVSHLSIDFSEWVCVQSLFLLSLKENEVGTMWAYTLFKHDYLLWVCGENVSSPLRP